MLHDSDDTYPLMGGLPACRRTRLKFYAAAHQAMPGAEHSSDYIHESAIRSMTLAIRR